MKKLKDLILEKTFKLSNQPVILKDLLDANAQFNEDFLVEPSKLHYKIRSINSYLIYAVICSVILLPCLLISHHFFTKVDFHLSIIATIVINSAIFLGYSIFLNWAQKMLTKKLIMRAWLIHFPYFSYERYSKKIEDIYNKALAEGVSKNQLEKYIMDELVDDTKKQSLK